jgi:hypothetical protein
VGLEHEGAVVGQGGDEVEVDEHAGARAARSAAPRLERGSEERIVEVALLDVDGQRAAPDGLAGLELVDRDAHARLGQGTQGVLDAARAHERLDVRERAPCLAQQREVRAARVPVDALADQRQERRLPPGQALAHPRQACRRVHRRPHEAPVSAREAQERPEISGEPTHTLAHDVQLYCGRRCLPATSSRRRASR